MVPQSPQHDRAPLIKLSKAGIVKASTARGVDFSITSSCYDPGAKGEPCGSCDSCLLRAKGFAEAGVQDPLVGKFATAWSIVALVGAAGVAPDVTVARQHHTEIALSEPPVVKNSGTFIPQCP